MMGLFQTTVAQSISLAGIGLHSGDTARVTIRPAPGNTGYLFVKVDSDTPCEIPATFDRVTDTTLATTIGIGDAKLGTIEHMMAAMRGMGVDNVIIEVEGGEVPIVDGSAAPFAYMIKKAGVEQLPTLRKYLAVKKEISFSDGDKFVSVTPHDTFAVNFTIDFPHPAIGSQNFSFDGVSVTFEQEISRARTFGFYKDVEFLKSKGLARGGSLENAVVLNDTGVINEEGVRYPDEFVRHKLLDLIGDIALLGYPVIGRVTAHKSGHQLNNQLCRELFENRKDVAVIEGEAVSRCLRAQ